MAPAFEILISSLTVTAGQARYDEFRPIRTARRHNVTPSPAMLPDQSSDSTPFLVAEKL